MADCTMSRHTSADTLPG